MSYNTRRSGVGGGYYAPTQSSASVGQRRNPPPLTNFPPAAQLAQMKPGGQQQQQQQQQQGNLQRPQQQPLAQRQQQIQRQQQAAQQQKGLQQSAQQILSQQQATQQAPQQQPSSHPPPVQQPQPVQQQPPPVQQQPAPVQQQPAPVQQQTAPVQQQPAPAVQPSLKVEETAGAGALKTENSTTESTNGTGEAQVKKQKPWRTNSYKFSKKERYRRRNQRLRKILQPKNALMVLNELIGSTKYNIVECPDGQNFKAFVMVEEIEHSGLGKSKPGAKAAAAEAALKHLVVNKLKKITEQLPPAANNGAENVDSDVDMKMEEEIIADDGLSWPHLASFALHKLFNSWDEGAHLAGRLVVASTGSALKAEQPSTALAPEQVPEKKPAKKLPENAASMNPVMLLNQMVPNAVYEEVSVEGSPPKVVFTFQCTFNDNIFVGSGSSKKSARRQCAQFACQEVLGIKYPEEAMEHAPVSAPAPAPAPTPVPAPVGMQIG